MGDKTLGDCVRSSSLNGQVFISLKPITQERHVFYKVNNIEGDSLRVFPVKYFKGSVVVEESVGLFYRQHVGDKIRVSR